jgi:hypothetical protein
VNRRPAHPQRFSLFVMSIRLLVVPSEAVRAVSSEGVDFPWSWRCVQPVSAFLFVTGCVFSVVRWRRRVALARILLCVVMLQTRGLLLCYLGLLGCTAGAKEMAVLRAVSNCKVSSCGFP